MKRSCWLVVCTLVAVTVPAWARQTFRAGTELVSVYATVTDRRAHLITDLTKDDFIVTDNGRPQPLSLFSRDVQPITAVVMLDRSGSMVEHEALVRDAAEQFVQTLLPSDKARIGSLGRDIVISPNQFTGDQNALLHVVRDQFQGPGPSPIWTAVDRSITALAKEQGRRVVLLFSDGYDDTSPNQTATKRNDVIRRAQHEGIIVYAIGVPGTGGSSVSFQSVDQGHERVMVPIWSKPPALRPHPSLKRLAELSGGGYFDLDWNDDLATAFTRIADELHRQYWLAFPPAALDGKVHKLTVSVRQRDLTVQARRTYVAAKPTESQD